MMAELVIIVLVIIAGVLTYWVFGDPDRPDRLFAPLLSINGRYYRIIMIIYWGMQTVNIFSKTQFVWGIIGLLLTAYWVTIYLKSRVEASKLRQAVPEGRSRPKLSPTN